MIKSYDYTSVITKDNHKKAIKRVDDLIRKGEWCKDVPSYQTKENLYDYNEFNIFVETFIESCNDSPFFPEDVVFASENPITFAPIR